MGPSTATARVRHSFLAVASFLALIPAARAESWSYGVDVGVGATDNVSLVSTDKTSQTMAMADVDFALQQQSLRLDSALKGNFSYLDFLQHAYSGELIGRFDGLAHLLIVPERLTWTLQDDFGQAQLNPFSAPTPANRENVDYLLMGPDLTLHMGSTGFLDLSARYARAQYQTSPFDSNRVLANLAWGLQLSAGSSLSLDGNAERVMFDNTAVNTDFERNSVFAHYEAQGARTVLLASLGASEVTAGGASTSGPLARLSLTRTLSAAAKLTLLAGREFTDASASFSALQTGAIGAISSAPAPQTSASYTSTYASVGWQYGRNRTTLAVSARWEQDFYEGQPLLDNGHSGAELKLDRQVTRALSAQLFGSLYYTDYAHANYTTQDELVGMALTLRQGRGLEYRLRYSHVSRIATGIGTGFNENIAFLTIGYRPRSPTYETTPGPSETVAHPIP
ncbi:MAG: hypothetical protein ABSF96_04865 [Steroidobacteraceae bacterium]|jgi:hypothetical protein